jgi:polyisoprenyl-teichoic acid--peptidoglycan teichoic acid transferase
MPKRLFDFIDAILLTIVVILALLIARILVGDGVQAVALLTPVTVPTRVLTTPLPATKTSVPPTQVRPTVASSPTRTPTATASPTATTPPTATSFPARGVYVPSVTPNATTVISNTPVPEPASPVPLPRGSVTIALLGSDKRPTHGDYRTDTIILVNVNPNLPAVTLLSIPRDLWVYIPGYQFNKINVADERGEFTHFPGGGAGLLKQTIEYNLGIHVDYYARVDFAGFMKIVDTLGGIDVIANCPLEDIFPDDPITENKAVTGTISITRPGVVHLDGKHALWYARSRENTSDWDRSLRQQRVLRAMYAKASQLGLVTRLPELWNDISSTVITDLKLNDIVWLATIGARLDSTRIKSRTLDGSLVYHWDTLDTHAWVVSPIPGKLGPGLQDIFSPPTNIAAQAQARVEVWNGSPYSDWGILAADRLGSEGFFVTDIASADRNDYAQTKIVDFSATSKGSRRAALANIFRVNAANTIAQPDANSQAQYRIIVGADYQPCTRARLPSDGLPAPAPTTTLPAP